MKRVRDYAQVKGDGTITEELANYALDQLEVDHLGLDDMDRRILTLIDEKFAGGPVGIETLSAALSEEKDTLEEVYEPFLIQEGLLAKNSSRPYRDRTRPETLAHVSLRDRAREP